MAKIEKSIELEVPARTAYNQLTQFREYPRFMSQVREVRKIDDTHFIWRAETGGKETEWTCEITDQVPDQRIAWRNTQGSRGTGEVRLVPLGENRCRLTFTADHPDEDQVTNAGKSSRTEEDLQGFKRFIEGLGRESGAWRGEVRSAQVSGGSQRSQQAGQADSSAGMASQDVADATRTAIDDVKRFGSKAVQTANENFNRAGQQAHELASHALKTQSSAMNAASTAMRPFRYGFLDTQPWFSGMLRAFEEPFSAMRRFSEEMQHELTDMLSRNQELLHQELHAERAWMPSVDIALQDGAYVVQADVPGIRKEDISVVFDNNQLVIHGERHSQRSGGSQGQQSCECHYGSFTRVIPLSEDVDVEQAEASVADGVLQVRLPVISERQRGHRIEISDRKAQDAQQRAGEQAETAAQRSSNASKNQQRRSAA